MLCRQVLGTHVVTRTKDGNEKGKMLERAAKGRTSGVAVVSDPSRCLFPDAWGMVAGTLGAPVAPRLQQSAWCLSWEGWPLAPSSRMPSE